MPPEMFSYVVFDSLYTDHLDMSRRLFWLGFVVSLFTVLVEMNANVRAAQRESKNGEISRVWEWIGALEDIDGGNRRRRSGRVSWGASFGDNEDREGSGVGIVSPKWEEGRPIY